MQRNAIRLSGFVSLCFFLCLFTSLLAAQRSSAGQAISDPTASQPAAAQPRILEPVDESHRAVLKGNTHPMARPQYDRGTAPPDLPMDRMLLVLKRSPEQEVGLRKLLDDQQSKASPSYHKWLTPSQFGEQFGPASEDIQTVTAWLQSRGLRVTQVSRGRGMIEFSGSAGQVQDAFHTSIHKYDVNGEQHWANANDPQIPQALTPVVAGVFSLHNFLKQPQIRFSDKPVPAVFKPGKPPQLTFSDGTNALGPGDYAKIYNIKPLYDGGIQGTGSSIAVVARSNINFQDVMDFYNVFGIATPSLQTVLNGPDPGNLGGGEEAEAVLDVTWSSSLAFGAELNFVVSASTDTTDGVDLSELYIVDNNLADVMTESFSICEAVLGNTEAQGISDLAEQAAAQGITYMVSSGDSGAAGCDDPNSSSAIFGLSVNALASTPFTVAVGGTLFNENGHNNTYWGANGSGETSVLSYIPENVWNESGPGFGLWSSGGGKSVFFDKPSWQTGTGVPADSVRDVPDISLTSALHDPYLLCLGGSCIPDSNGNIFVYFIGGTSAAAPAFAGIMTLVDQKMASRQGLANYVLYPLAATEDLSQCNGSKTSGLPASTCIFNDVTVGNNSVPGLTGYSATIGYDLATGLGSVNVANLANNWASVGFSATTTTLTLTPTTGVTHGTSVAVHSVVSLAPGGAPPTGSVALLTSGNKSVQVFPLVAGSVTSTTNLLPGGSYSVTAHYSGDGTYAASDSPPVSVTVTPEPSTTATSVLTADQFGNPIPFTSGPYGSFVYLRADVAANSGQGTAAGAVTFTDNGVPIDGNPYILNSEGNTATPNGIFTFAGGSHSIVASYAGDASLNASMSSAVSFTISDFTLTPSSSTVTVASPGATGSLTLAIAGQGGYNGTITFSSASCSGLPRLSTCSFSPSSITGDGSTTLTITTTAPHTAMLEGFGWWTTSLGTFAGVFLLGAPSRRRRWGMLFSLVICVCVATGVGCGGGSSSTGGGGSPGTPVGSSTVTVTATGGGVTHTTSFTLTVQ